MKGALLGPAYSQSEIETRLRKLGARFVTVCEDELVVQCANAIAQQKAVGWFQGRMEFGPRALGARSILADPRSSSMQSVLNLKVKKRESFRPFAPSITREAAHRYFDLDVESPYMLLTAQARGGLPATTHLDGSARVQTVGKEWHPRYHALLTAFEAQTGCPVVVNTSFNVRGEPIVCTPEDTFRCFMQTDIEVLAIGDCLLRKEEQDASLTDTFRQEFEPD